MEVTINVNDYLSEERIKEICEEKLRSAIHEQIRKESDIERILSNTAYEFVFKLICEEWKKYEKDFEQVFMRYIGRALEVYDRLHYELHMKPILEKMIREMGESNAEQQIL